MAPEAGTATQTAREVGQIVPNPVARKKILLADDHHLILDALRAMMSADFDVAAVDNSEAFMDAAMSFQPDVAILDISMPGGDGLTTARRVLERSPYLPIIFLSMYAEPLYIDQAAQVGAKGIFVKGGSCARTVRGDPRSAGRRKSASVSRTRARVLHHFSRKE